MLGHPIKRRGRPPLDAINGSTPVRFRLSTVTYDELYRLAYASGEDMSVLIREAIEARLLRERRERPR